MKTIHLFIVLIIAVLTAMPVTGQKRHLNAAEIDTKFSQVWNVTEVLKKNYTWKEKTEVIRKGEIVNTIIEEISFTADGKQKKKTLKNEEAALPSTFIIHQFAESSKAKTVRFLQDLSVFLKKYSLADAKTRHSFFLKASVGAPDKNGIIVVSGNNVLAKDDKVRWWMDTKSYALTKATISTTFEDTGIEFTGYYGYFRAGMNYMSKAEISVPDKDIVVRLEFYDFK
jgi:hypothetical protein